MPLSVIWFENVTEVLKKYADIHQYSQLSLKIPFKLRIIQNGLHILENNTNIEKFLDEKYEVHHWDKLLQMKI